MSTTFIVYCSCHHQPNHKNSMEVILKSHIVFILSLSVFAVCDSKHPASSPYYQHQHQHLPSAYNKYWLFHWSTPNKMHIPQPAASPGTWCWFHHAVSPALLALKHIQVSQVCTLRLLGLLLSSFSPSCSSSFLLIVFTGRRGAVGSLRKLQADSLYAMEIELICIHSHLFIYIYIYIYICI